MNRGTLNIYIGMCRRENKNQPIHPSTKFWPKFGLCIYRGSTISADIYHFWQAIIVGVFPKFRENLAIEKKYDPFIYQK